MEPAPTPAPPKLTRTLIVGGGGLRGAYTVGALREIHAAFGPSCFDFIYAVSVGVFAATFFANDQADIMENTWRMYVHGRQLIDYSAIWTRRPVINIEYLIALFQSSKSRLDLSRLLSMKTALQYVLTDYADGTPVYHDARTSDVFQLMRAAAALPGACRTPVFVGDGAYIDGGISDPVPVARALQDKPDQLVVILNYPRHYKLDSVARVAAYLFIRSSSCREALLRKPQAHASSFALLDAWCKHSPERAVVIAPGPLPAARMTRSAQAIHSTIELGKRDTAALIRSGALNLG